jgi:hypothetical protein
MSRLGTVTLTGFPGRTGVVLLASGGGGVVPGLVAFDDDGGLVGTTDVVGGAGRPVVPEADEGPAAVVCCRPSSASLVLNCR